MIRSPWTAPPETFMMVLSPPWMRQSPASSAASWPGLTNTEPKGAHQCRHACRSKKARELGAEGIGLCRTEHMFFEGNRIDAFREMICSETEEEREAALDKILPEQQGDFEKLYEALEGNPVTIRFLDPPLHEFVPTEDRGH